MALHTAGSLLHFHPHAHSFALLGGIDERGAFHELPAVDTQKLTSLFGNKIYAALLKEDLLTDDEIESLKRWPERGALLRRTPGLTCSPATRYNRPMPIPGALSVGI